MHVKQRLRLNAVVMSLSIVGVLAVLLVTAYRVNEAIEATRTADAIITTAFERLPLRTDYMRTGSERAREQAAAKYRQIDKLLKAASERFTAPEDKKIIDTLIESNESIGKTFRAIVANRKNTGTQGGSDTLSREVEDRLLSQLNMRVYELVVLGSKLQESSNTALLSALKNGGGGIFIVLLLVGVVVLINSGVTYRSISARISRLQDGAVLIGEGNLDHRIGMKGDDEFAVLSDAFDAMASKLRGSHRNLEKEIEERKRAEEALRKAYDELELRVQERTKELTEAYATIRMERHRLYDVLETLPVMICLLTPDYHVAFANKSFRDRFGESHGRHCYDYCFGKTGPCDFCESYNVLKNGQPHYWEVTGSDGSVIAAYDFPFTDIDGSQLILEMDIDITEQRLTEKALKDLNETLERRVAERTTEVGAANTLLRDSRKAALNVMEDALAARRQAEETSVKLAHEAEERRHAEEDVLKLSEDMAARNVELESVNRELEAFIYSISHDLRAPVRTMAGFARFLAEDYEDKLDDQAKDYLRRINLGSEKMTLLINDLLRLSKISRQEFDRTDIDLSKLASSVISGFRTSDPGRSVEVSVAEGLTAFADLRLVEIVLSNLLRNAWKFTSKTEKAQIEFGAHRHEGDITYFVKDNGAGFNPEYMEKMFWPFQRLHTEEDFEGTGIGLTIVERIIRRHSGKVWAEGKIGKGATIYFTLGQNRV